jgi:hypothetical protein
MNCKRLKSSLLFALFGASLASFKLVAAPVTVPDFSFELWTNAVTGFGLPDGTATAGPDVGAFWRAAGNGGVNLLNPTDTQFAGTTGSPGTLPAPGDGTNYFVIGLGHDGFGWQTVGSVQSNTIYTLTVAVGNTLLGDGGRGSINLLSGTFPSGTVLGSAPVDSIAITPGTFADTTLVFATGQHGGKPLTILLQGTGLSGTALIYDNVRLDATPAPAAATALVPAASPSTNVYVGTIVTLSEDPSGQTPISYQWQTDNGSGGATFSNVSGGTGTNLVVDTSSFTGTPVEYQVIVSNGSGVSTSAPVILTASQGLPVLVADTLPSSGSDVVGGQIKFSAVFDGSRPITYQWEFQDTNGNSAIDIPNATNSTLTISNLQISDYGVYYLIASNSLGTAQSTPVVFAVNQVPDETNNVVIATANQTGLGGTTTFSPSWIITTNGDLLAGTLPSTVGPGAFNDPQQHIAGTPAVLTDGKAGTFYPEGVTSPDVITGGTVGSGAGQYVIYTLPASATGWDITNVVTYGGWADAGRDEQRYTLFYSTIAAPSNFTAFADVAFNPSNPSGVQSATRVTIFPSGASALVKNVAALKFDFTPLANGAENGFVGFSEFQVYGVHSAPAPVLANDTEPGSASDVVGSTITFTATITGGTSYQWFVIAGGTTNSIPGATTQTLTLSNLQFSDSGTYLLVATNSSGTTRSSGSTLTVNSPGNALITGTGDVTASGANQTGRGSTYTPNWLIGTNNDLVLGTFPTGIGAGVYNGEGSGGIAILTDGRFGSVGGGVNVSLATVGQNAGRSLTYTLTGPASGFDITNIITYGGWNDGGRDQQAYTVSYSTVQAPAVFNTIATVSFNPSLPGSVPSSDRLLVSSPSGPIATNVAKIMFDFTNPGIENGYGGLAEIGVFGTASAAIPLAPYMVADILPVTGSDVVGSQVTFKASFNGTAPIAYQWQKVSGGVTNNIPGATGSTLTLNNLQLSDSGFYQLQAANSQGVSYSSTNAFTVNPVPAANGNGVIVSPANQSGNGAFTPTWSVASGSIITGMLPSSTGTGGSFTADPGEGGLPVLTDGALNLFGGSVAGLATCGSGNGGHSITYTLSGSASGYNLNSIISYGGWADGGRDQQAYTASYSTVANPTTFITIGVANYNPALPGSVPSADRVVFTSATTAPIATNVAMVKFNFLSPAGENGYSGYAEFQIFGSAAGPALRPTIGSAHIVGGNFVLTGSGGSPGGTYSVLTSTNVGTALSTWTTNTSGTFNGAGGFSNSIPVSSSEPARFFLLKSP